MRYMRWQTLMPCQITTQITNRCLDSLHILLQLVKFSTRRQVRHFRLYITDNLKYGPVLVNNVLHKHTQMVNVCITHTTSLALFQRDGKRRQLRF
jgi:hypothetical protein